MVQGKAFIVRGSFHEVRNLKQFTEGQGLRRGLRTKLVQCKPDACDRMVDLFSDRSQLANHIGIG